MTGKTAHQQGGIWQYLSCSFVAILRRARLLVLLQRHRRLAQAVADQRVEPVLNLGSALVIQVAQLAIELPAHEPADQKPLESRPNRAGEPLGDGLRRLVANHLAAVASAGDVLA